MSLLLEDLGMPSTYDEDKNVKNIGCGWLVLIGGAIFMALYTISKAYESKHPEELVKPVQKTQMIKPVQQSLDTLKAFDTLKIMNQINAKTIKR